MLFFGLLVAGLMCFTALRAPAASQERKTWQYRSVEAMPGAVQATMDELGREGWEVFSIHGASAVSNDGAQAKLVPHTFYVFARRPL